MEIEIKQLQEIVDQFFSQLKARFQPEIKITVLIRNLDAENSDCVFTDDEFRDSLVALKYLANREQLLNNSNSTCLQ